MRQRAWLFSWRGGVLLFGGALFFLLMWRSLLSSSDEFPTGNLMGVGVNAGDEHEHGHAHGHGHGHEHGHEHGHGYVQDQGPLGHAQPHAQDQNGKLAREDDVGDKKPAGVAAGAKKDLKPGAGTGQGAEGDSEGKGAASVEGGAGGEKAVAAVPSHGPGPRVPLIFHQIFRDENLPAPYMMCLTALLRHHRIRDPNKAQPAAATTSGSTDYEYDYYLWTDGAVDEYFEERGKTNELYKQFAAYSDVLQKTDVIRYFVLYEFGGVYLDLDLELVAPLGPLLARGYPCAISEENVVQSNAILYKRDGVTNFFIACRPRHPFSKLIIESLAEFAKKSDQTLERTGPSFITSLLKRYRESNPKLDAICREDPSAHEDCVAVLPYELFDTLDLQNVNYYINYCNQFAGGMNQPPKNGEDYHLRRCREFMAGMRERGSFVDIPGNTKRLGAHHYLHLGVYPRADRSGGIKFFPIGNLMRGHWTFRKSSSKMEYVSHNLIR